MAEPISAEAPAEEVPLPPARPDARFLGTAIVLTTLLAAIVGYLLNHASTEEDKAAGLAQRFALEASAELPASRQQAEADYFNYVLQQAEIRKANAAFWESLIAGGGDPRWPDMQALAEDVAAASGASVPADLGADSPFGPAQDPAFPNAFFTVRTAQATKLTALQDAENEIAAGWSKLTSKYSAVLTLFAVALFLLGTGMSLYGASRLMFAIIGVTLVIIGSTWSLSEAQTPPGEASQEAADAFTLGEHYLATATSREDFDKAIAAYTTAIDERPGFARAYLRRAAAEGARGSQAVGGGFMSNVEDDSLERKIADEKKAYELGLRDTDLGNDLGFDMYLDWLRHGSGSPPAESIRLFREVTDADAENPVTWMNLAVALVADGKPDEAREVYEIALDHIFYNGISADQPRAGAYGRQIQWLAGGMTDLDNLATGPATEGRDEIRDSAREFKAFLATQLATGGEDAPDAADIEIPEDSVSFVLSGENAQVTFDAPDGWDQTDDGQSLLDQAVTVVWYQRQPVDSGRENAWNGIAELGDFGVEGFGPLEWDDFDHTYFDNQHFLQAGLACLPSAEYKAEVFINGELEVSHVEYWDTGDLVPGYETDMGAGFCRPADWIKHEVLTGTAEAGNVGSLDGVVFGYDSPDGTSGAYMLRIYPHRDNFYSPPNGDLLELTSGMMEYAVGLLAGQPLAGDLVLQYNDPGRYFMQLERDWTDFALYSSASSDMAAYVAGGQTDDNAVLVSIVYGPKSELSEDDDFFTQLEQISDSTSII